MNSKQLWAMWGLVLLMGASPTVVVANEKSEHSKGEPSHECAMQQESPEHYLHRLLKHSEEIGLTSDQVAKLKTIQLDLKRTRIKTEADIQLSELDLAALTEDEQADLSAIESKVKESELLEAGLRVAAIKAKRDAVSLLTPEQREKEKAEHKKMMKEMGGMMGMGQKEKAEGEKKKHMGGMRGKGMMGGKGGQEDQSPDQPNKEEHQH